MVRAWVSGTPDYGVQLSGATEDVPQNWRYYRSYEYGGYDTYPFTPRGPVLFISYTPAPTIERYKSYFKVGPALVNPTDEEMLAHRNVSASPQEPPALTPEQSMERRVQASATVEEDLGAELVKPDDVTDQEWDGLNANIIAGEPVPEPTPTPTPTGGPDTTPPTVTGTDPADSATGIMEETTVRATFSEPVTNAQLTVKGPNGAAIAGNAAMDTAQQILTFTPAQPLAANTTYTAEAAQAQDAAGNTMTPHSWSFTTTDVAAHWRFDEGSGTAAADTSGHGHNATLDTATAWIPGRSGSALTNNAQPTSPAADQTSPQPTAAQQAAQQRKPVEVTVQTTETRITYAQPDGKTFKTEIAAGPVRTKRNGTWVPIDTSLMEQGGVLKPKALASGAMVEVSTGGTGAFVKMTAADGQSYALRWPTVLPKPAISKNTATFTDAAGRGADLVVTVLPTGFRHDVVLRERPAAPLELRIGVETGGLTLTEGKGGRLLLTGDKDKKLVASAPQPMMWDAGAKGRSAKGLLPQARRAKIATDVVTTDGRTELVLKPDHAFLSDPATKYPVRVDPTTTLPFNHDVDVSSTNTASSPADPTGPIMMAGTRTGSLKYRVHLRFDTAGLTGATVTDAKLSLLNISAQACGSAVGAGIQVRRLTSAWDENNLYWANKPTSTTEDAQINKAGYDSACADPTPLEWPVTGIAQDWAAGAANHGLVLQSPTETNVNNFRVFPSSEEVSEFNSPPTLTVTTTGPASAPAVSALTVTPAQVVAGVTTVTSLTPQLAATVTDTIGGSLTGQFEIEHDPTTTGQGTGQIWAGASAAVASGAQATVSVPAGKLTDGWKVRWRARAANTAASTISAWSGWQNATIDVLNVALPPLARTAAPVIRTDESFTVSAWLRWADINGAYTVLDQKGAAKAPFRIGNDPDRGLVFTLSQSDAVGAMEAGVLSDVRAPANEWFHFAGVYDSTADTATLYLNGQAIGTAPVGFAAWNAATPLTLGTSMRGDIDDVRLHQRALPATEIADLHALPPTGPQLRVAAAPTVADTPGGSPYFHIKDPDECQRDSPEGGWYVKNTFSWCFWGYTEGTIEIERPGPDIKSHFKARVTMTAHTYMGRKLSNKARGRETLNSRQFLIWVRVDDLHLDGDPTQIHSMRIGLKTGTGGCTVDKPDGILKTVQGWDGGPDEAFVLTSDETRYGHLASRVGWCYPKIFIEHPKADPGDRFHHLNLEPGFRCDSSPDINFSKGGCVVWDYKPIFRLSKSPTIKRASGSTGPNPVVESAQHIWEALHQPALTKPTYNLKHIPGSPLHPDRPNDGNYLARTTDTETKGSLGKANRDHSVDTCQAEFSTPGHPYTEGDKHCDEFPHAATYQGSSKAGLNFSVKPINGKDNCTSGSWIGKWWDRNRILNADPFWVEILDTQSPGRNGTYPDHHANNCPSDESQASR